MTCTAPMSLNVSFWHDSNIMLWPHADRYRRNRRNRICARTGRLSLRLGYSNAYHVFANQQLCLRASGGLQAAQQGINRDRPGSTEAEGEEAGEIEQIRFIARLPEVSPGGVERLDLIKLLAQGFQHQ
jgi:hypothetical protein